MSQLVWTAIGLIPLDQLEIAYPVEIGDNYLKVAIEYRFRGEIVKRSVMADGLRPPGMDSVEGKLS